MTVDLTAPEVTRRLLHNPRDWRERAVESLRIGSAQFVSRERSLQCRPLFPVVADLRSAPVPPSTEAFLVLPLALLPKQPLVEFGVRGPREPPVLLRRPEIAERESCLVRGYAEEAGLPLDAGVVSLLPVLLGFTDGSWAAVQADARRGGDPVREYLAAGLGEPLGGSSLERLKVASGRAHAALDPYNEASTTSTSAVESPFLAVPPLVENGYVNDAAAAVAAVEAYADFVGAAAELAAAADKPSAAGDLLRVLADYGRHWELMVLAEVPLDRPFTITYRYLDPVGVRGWRARIAPAVVIADAESNHVTLSVEDPGARLAEVVGRHPRTGEVAQMGSTSRQSPEMHAFYVWEVDVDFRVLLSARLGVLRRVSLANVLLACIVLLVATALAVKPPATTAELAVVAGPTAAVASLLLLREPSTLASRLRLPYSTVVALSVLLLVGVATWRFTALP